MIIGTPFRKSSRRVLLLGSGELGREIVFTLQRFCCEVTAASSYPEAPAQQTAQKSITADLTNSEQLLQIIHQEKPDIIFTEIEYIAYDALLKAEKTGLSRVIPSAHAVETAIHREKTRRLAAEELCLVTSAYEFASSCDELLSVIKNKIGYPCVVKPMTSFSGKGQSIVSTEEEVASSWDRAQNEPLVHHPRVIVESFLEFDYEITLLAVRHELPTGKYVVDFCDPIGQVQHNGNYHESWQPSDISAKALERAHTFSSLIVNRLGGVGLFGVEFFVRGEEVWFSEISSRPHDTGLVTLCSQYQSEFELHVRAALGFPIDVQLREPGASHVIASQIEAEDVVYDNLAAALSYPKTSVHLFGKPKSMINRRMGISLANGQTTDEARFTAKKAAQSVIIRKAR